VRLATLNENLMKILLFILLCFCYIPLSAQSTEQAEDTLWIEPFLASLKIVLSNAEQVDFVLLEPKYANEVYDLPNGVYLASSLSEIENYVSEDRKVYYVCLTSFKIDSWGAQIDWKNISARYQEKTSQIHYTTHVNYSFIYHYDGTSWSRGPSAIQNNNHSHQSKDK
jgi:hypothetical protein